MVTRDAERPAGVREETGAGRLSRPVPPALFFLLSIFYQELFLKLYCFHGLTVRGVIFTLLFTLPIAAALGVWCFFAG